MVAQHCESDKVKRREKVMDLVRFFHQRGMEVNRLYTIADACNAAEGYPWTHPTLVMRQLPGLKSFSYRPRPSLPPRPCRPPAQPAVPTSQAELDALGQLSQKDRDWLSRYVQVRVEQALVSALPSAVDAVLAALRVEADRG